MLSTGLILILLLLAGLAVCLVFGIRLTGWRAVTLGAAGIVYCYLATSSLGLIPVFFASCVVLLYGVVGVAVKCFSRLRRPT